ncbi:hypothetical protein O6H91_12G025800 [Diphasiastrum complanatum]|uniref:Uncharacterized protein n=10 Tax=Diphasiastrum complanatum TaxID=34168 RepID=A0ACC2BZR1_DIPCM|nr:hypothetical protein O6H91_12G025800 [Diphasiastrum complanatum]KAJ7535269.1 hypothetical protein O6H91_12G025800 [Diphasiastrum complanatum]KAJ7535270.1 hypothetical protein O6H91_12G025800 [Diphasiastrum complanatum]KAJ7535271.1 hypothetical protein O6H91_12G025800 [Diphasiastrum complanatum]KAJ7535272.1 hypothetical protein O6H91_12G025800 [Diphasiastrum complanatum]
MTDIYASALSLPQPSRVKMHLMLIVAQLGFAGFEVLARVALVSGVSPFVFAVYRNVIAFAVLAPVSYFFEKTKRPPLTLSIIGQLFILGLIGVFINQVTYFTGLSLTSATFTSAMLNSTPAFTFILAAILRFEKVRRRSIDGQAKILGTTLSVSGAILMTVYKGPALLRTTSHGEPAASIGKFNGLESFHFGSWQFGSLSLLFTCLSFATYLIIQAPLSRKYPAPLSIAAGACFFGAVDLTILAVILDRRPSIWILKTPEAYISAFYAGIIASGLVAGIQSWGVRIRRGGPVIVSAYQPLETVIVAILGFFILKETLNLGSLIGAILVILGLYLVTWGQGEEKRISALKAASAEVLPTAPLLEAANLEEMA